MTHSHDTSTPAMSAETVPSEEFVLVPREPTREMMHGFLRAGPMPAVPFVECYRAMIAAAPTLSASHLAKEGGEAGAVEVSGSFNEWFLSLPLERQAILRDDKWMLAEAAWAARQPLPQPSPALAKGGDAVREALVEARHMIKSVTGGIIAVHHKQAMLAKIDAALSTPTEGPASQKEVIGTTYDGVDVLAPAAPSSNFTREEARSAVAAAMAASASQTEGMGGGASEIDDRRLARIEAQMLQHGGVDSDDMEWMARIVRAALTPPETAEAVPVEGEEAERAAFDAWWTQSGRKGAYDVLAGQAAYIAWRERASDPEAARLREELGQCESDKSLLYTKWQDAVKALETAREALAPFAAASEGLADCIHEGFAICGREVAPRKMALITAGDLRAARSAVDRYRDPKTGSFQFPTDVATIVRRLDATERERDDAVKALETAREDERDRLYQQTMIAFNHSGYDESFRTAGIVLERWGAMLPANRAAARSASSQGGE